MRTLRELMARARCARGRRLRRARRRAADVRRARRAARAVAASALSRLGVGVGDRVALCSANNPDWIVTFWACAALGAVVVPLNAWWKAEELEFGLDDSECARCSIADARRLALIADRLDAIPRVGARVRDRRGARPSEVPSGPAVLGARRRRGRIRRRRRSTRTTSSRSSTRRAPPGSRKGATLTHRQVIANLSNIIVLGVAAGMRGTPPPEMARACSRRRYSSSRCST